MCDIHSLSPNSSSDGYTSDEYGFGDERFPADNHPPALVDTAYGNGEQSSLFTRWWFTPKPITPPAGAFGGCSPPAIVKSVDAGDHLPLWSTPLVGSGLISGLPPRQVPAKRPLTTLVVLSASGTGAAPLVNVKRAVHHSITQCGELPVPLDFFLTQFTDGAKDEAVMHDVFVQSLCRSDRCVFYMERVDFMRADVQRLQAIVRNEGLLLVGRPLPPIPHIWGPAVGASRNYSLPQ
jgi:hypothetical protein